MGLSADIHKFVTLTKERQIKVMKASLLATFNGAIIRSPVGNPEIWVAKNSEGAYVDYIAEKGYPADYVGGQFRANWRIDFGSVSNNIKDTENQNESMLSLKQGIDKLQVGDTLYFTNPMPYGPRLEYDGWSTQAPDGMVRAEAANFRKNVNKATAKNR